MLREYVQTDTDGVPCTEYTCYTTQRIRIVTNRAESSKPVIDNRARAYSDSRVSPSTLQEMDGREDVDVDEEGGRSNENYFEPVLPHSTKTVAYGRPSTMTNHHRSRRDNARLHPSTPARFSRFAAFLGGRGEREAMPRKSRAMRCRTRGSSDAGNRWGGGRGTIPLADRWNESRR